MATGAAAVYVWGYTLVSRVEDEPANESRDVIQARAGATTQTAVLDAEDLDTAGCIDPPGAGLSHEELTVAVIPEQVDEFTCASCFLVRHRSRLADFTGEAGYCTDCEG